MVITEVVLQIGALFLDSRLRFMLIEQGVD